MTNKVLLIVAVALALIAAVHANNLNIGYYRRDAFLVRSDRVTLPAIRNYIQQRTVSYSGFRNVTLIQAFDQFNNGTGGWASLSGGGLGQRSAHVSLRSSSMGRGLSFQVNIYAV